MMKYLSAPLVCGLSWTLSGIGQGLNAQSNTTLTIVLEGVRHKTGQICMRVFDQPKGFPFKTTGEIKSDCVKITGSSMTYQFQGLKAGIYAVAVVDDQDGDQKLRRNFLGIPQEGFGISNNPRVTIGTGVPTFNKASFAFSQTKAIRIAMKYSLDR